MMHLELKRATVISECFYEKPRANAANDRKFNADGTISYEAVKGFVSPLKTMSTSSSNDEHQKLFQKRELLKEEERDVDSHVYTNRISSALIGSILIEKCLNNDSLRQIYFSIKSRDRQASVVAHIKDGFVECVISTDSHILRRHLDLKKSDIIYPMRDDLLLNVSVTVVDEVNFFRI